MTDKIVLNNLSDLQNQTTAVSTINANNATLVTAVDNTLSRDGTQPNTMLSNLDMNNYQVINLPTPSAPQSPLRLQDLPSFNAGTFTVNTIPVGGTTNQLLEKKSGTDYDTDWTSAPSPTQINYKGATSGTTVVKPAAIASGTLTLPAATDTVVGKATTDILTNKTIDTAGPNILKIAGTSLTAVTGTGNVVLGSAPTITSPIVNTSLTATGVTIAAGTASVDPLTLTAGTNLTVPAAGSVEYDGNAFYATALASARQQVDAEQYVIASSNSATYNNTLLDSATAAPVFTTTTSGTAAGAITVSSSKVYAFQFMYNLTNTGTTSHTWATLFAGTATFNPSSAYTVDGDTGTAVGVPTTGSLTGFLSGSTMSTPVVVTGTSTSATEQVTVTGSGIFSVNAGGTIIPSLKASARPGATGTPGVTVIAGSYFRIWQMGNASSVGNWS